MEVQQQAARLRSRPRYGLHFAATLALTLVMLCAMTVFYGFRELRSSAHDIAAALLKGLHAQQGLGMTPEDLVNQGLHEFRDMDALEVCVGERCVSRAGDQGWSLPPLELLPPPCATLSSADGAGAARITVCMALDDLVADIQRDIAMLVFSQGIGFGIWLAATRRHAQRRRQLNDKVAQASTTDGATGLLNRTAFRDRLGALAEGGTAGWLVVVGIDELKATNELHGSAVGDEVIFAVAQRLRSICPAPDTLGRIGGDEFAAFVPGTSPAVLERMLGAVRSTLRPPVDACGLLRATTVCAGAVEIERHLSACELLRRAHVALRSAKKVGPDSQSIFNVAFDVELRKTHQLRLDLQGAVSRGDIRLMYQPIVDARGQVVVAEALARWQHPQLNAVSPEVFIPAAEASGIIHELGVVLLKQACADLVAARAGGLPLRRMAVNMSPAQLGNPDWVDIALAVVAQAGLSPKDIELELTESAAMASRHDATDQLHRLAEAGFAISIDDFGTGYSSLSRLQTLPISKLKIDRSFVSAYLDPSGAALIEAMLDLSRRLQLTCVAEGVETMDQMRWLQSRGCELFQGYGVGRPMPLTQLVAGGFRIPSTDVARPAVAR